VSDDTVLFQAEQVQDLGFPGDPRVRQFWDPSPMDAQAFELGLRQALEEAVEHPERFDTNAAQSESRARFVSTEAEKILEHLGGYRRQVFGIVVDGEQRLYVSFLPGADWDSYGDSFEDWKERTIAVSDGGFWFWSIQFTPSTGEYQVLDSHGYA